MTPICHCLTREDACYIERLLISEHNTLKPFGYNLTAGGDGTLSYKRPLHQLLTHSAKMKHFYEAHPERRVIIGNQHRGKTMSAESRQRVTV
jgi:hypothetical protein